MMPEHCSAPLPNIKAFVDFVICSLVFVAVSEGTLINVSCVILDVPVSLFLYMYTNILDVLNFDLFCFKQPFLPVSGLWIPNKATL